MTWSTFHDIGCGITIHNQLHTHIHVDLTDVSVQLCLVTSSWTRQVLDLRLRTLGCDGAVVSSQTHWPSSSQFVINLFQLSTEQSSPTFTEALVDAIFRYSRRVFFLYVAKRQLLIINQTSGRRHPRHGLHGQLSQQASAVHAAPAGPAPVVCPHQVHVRDFQTITPDQSTTWPNWLPVCQQAHRRSRAV